MKFRILTDGEKFRVQYREGFFHRWCYVRTLAGITNFDSYGNAQDWITVKKKGIKRAKKSKKKWRVITRRSLPML